MEYNLDVFFQTLLTTFESVVGHLHKAVRIELKAWGCNIDPWDCEMAGT